MRVVIAGGGEIGKELAMLLSSSHEVVVIERNRSQVDLLSQYIDGQVIHGDTTSLGTLLAVGISGAGLFIAATGVDEVNLLACVTAKRLGVPLVATCLQNPEYHSGNHLLAEEMQAVDLLLDPVLLAAKEVLKQIIEPGMTANLLLVGGRVALVAYTLSADSHFTGQRIKEIELPGQGMICAITRNGETWLPAEDHILTVGDLIYIVGTPLRKAHWFPQRAQRLLPQRILIGGGSSLGYQIAVLLGKLDLQRETIIIAANRTRCEELAEKLPRTRVYLGDVTDKEFFVSIINKKSDMFVAASDDDLVNVLLALLAKSMDLTHILAVLRSTSCQAALAAVGNVSIVSPPTLFAEAVFRLLNREKARRLSILGRGPVQAWEIVVQVGMSLVGKRFGRDRLPDGAIWCALVRNGELLSLTQQEGVQVGDHLLLLLPDGHSATSMAYLMDEGEGKQKSMRHWLEQP
ncbi:MAG: NAD-binding protein [Firmicutes bacterium]|nr:NAD-binding protein [Bacillota bacterium]